MSIIIIFSIITHISRVDILIVGCNAFVYDLYFKDMCSSNVWCNAIIISS